MLPRLVVVATIRPSGLTAAEMPTVGTITPRMVEL
jgi:hypothetical protein